MQHQYTPASITCFLDGLAALVRGMPEPLLVKLGHEYNRDPFIILIGCLLSLRTRDTVTYKVCKQLFAHVRTPHELLEFPFDTLKKIIHPVNYHLKKAYVLKEVAQELLTRFGGHVPVKEEALLSLPGVGRKTANMVRAEAFGIPALGVDTHVHRLANEVGLVATSRPEDTEYDLKKIIPKERWIETHRSLVMCGQNRCNILLLKPLLQESKGHAEHELHAL
jgi:endonuclease III